jgi:SAM-dependent methyltransferase
MEQLTVEERNLRSMGDIDKYANWQYALIAPYISGNVLEIGGGVGTFTERIIKHPDICSLTVTETNNNNMLELRKRFGSSIKFLSDDLESDLPAGFTGAFDTVVSVNVMEHINDDLEFFSNCCKCIKKGGVLIHLVPAKKFLYGTIDGALNHYRRYEPNDLKYMAEQNDLKILKLKYMNMLGALGWFYQGKISRHAVHKKEHLELFNRFVPFVRKLEDACPIPFGLSLVFIAVSE